MVVLNKFTGKRPNKCKDLSEELKPYFYRKNELAVKQGCLIWKHRLIISDTFRKLLEELRITNLGIVKMKSIARSYIW